MVSLKDQLLEAQNQLLECRKNDTRIDIKINELIERADFYERLHNKEQEKLYEAENKYTVLKRALDEKQEELSRQEQECVALKQELEELRCRQRETAVDNISSKQLLAVMRKRLGNKFLRR